MMESPVLPPVSEMVGRTVHERVRASLRLAIVRGQFLPGQRLHQNQLAGALQVSVTPVREALRDLSADGLVLFDANRGATVASLGLDDFLEIRRLFETLEPLNVRLAAERVTDGELEALYKAQAEIESNPDDYLVLNRGFHDRLTAAARSARLATLLGSLVGTANLVVNAGVDAMPERVEQGIREHRAILDALTRRDGDAAYAAALAHLTPTWDAVEALVRATHRSAGS
ncbi:conserved hypothetical protein [Frankia canadensis]|uniref:HTH gntR-type domain-containing protein n=1 Tax=Frankia canadensis TaxID=1836972 RepID=A0A2I2KKB0_9ACTN|nr:GntR family transcriptional regulator [Frankia canadensis]SNQ46086.1 conserved hypothetical protein [Frankia canadensis]SOU53376.1 conserved hypothetical protein [Frankia canadensis]